MIVKKSEDMVSISFWNVLVLSRYPVFGRNIPPRHLSVSGLGSRKFASRRNLENEISRRGKQESENWNASVSLGFRMFMKMERLSPWAPAGMEKGEGGTHPLKTLYL